MALAPGATFVAVVIFSGSLASLALAAVPPRQQPLAANRSELPAGSSALGRSSRILSGAPDRQVEDLETEGPAGQAVQPRRQVVLPYRPDPGRITFPVERLQTAEDRVDSVQTRAAWDNMYSGCASTKNCFGFPEGCEAQESCRALVTVAEVNGVYTFSMRATDAKYVAVGLAPSEKMYGASVIECVNEDGNGIKAYMSKTSDAVGSHGWERMPASTSTAINLISSQAMDAGLFCEVTRVTRTRVNGEDYNLDQQAFHLILASGTQADANGLSYHGKNRAGSANARLMADYGSFQAASNWPMRLHGALMVLAWVFAATVGKLAARYYKAAWGKEMLCGKALWFAWHRMMMLLVLALHLVAFIAALIFLKGWSTSSGVHGILGGIVTGLAFLQGLGGLFRPGPDHPRRPIFNWLHLTAGHLAYVLAVLTIFFAVPLAGAGLPSYLYYILAVWVLFMVAMHGLHTLTEVKSFYFLIILFGAAVFALAILVVVVMA